MTCLAAMSAIVAACLNPAYGGITATGDVLPDPLLITDSATLFVGESAAGTLRVDAGDVLRVGSTVVGYQTSAAGAVEIEGGELIAPGGIVLGNDGQGTMSLLGNSRVESRNFLLGRRDGSMGVLTMVGDATGPAELITTGDFLVGASSSNGSVDIGYGARLWSERMSIGTSFGTGELVVHHGGEMHVSERLRLRSSNTSVAGMQITDGGLIRSNYSEIYSNATITAAGAGSRWENFGLLRLAGSDGKPASIVLSNQAVLTTGNIEIYNDDATLRVSGYRSAIEIAGELEHTGTNKTRVEVLAGGRLDADALVVNSLDTTGNTQVLVSGPGSIVNLNQLSIAKQAGGHLLIENAGEVRVAGKALLNESALASRALGLNGGVLRSHDLYMRQSDVSGAGDVYANGLVSNIDLLFDDESGTQLTLPLGPAGETQSTLHLHADQGAIGVGYYGDSSLTIRDSVQINSTDGMIGYHAGMLGTALIEGSGTTWFVQNLRVGRDGAGLLEVRDGAKLITGDYARILGAPEGVGPLSTVTVSGDQTLWDHKKEILVGQGDYHGALFVRDHAMVATHGLNVGMPSKFTGGKGWVTVEDAGYLQIYDEDAVIGEGNTFGVVGEGSLTIDSGGRVKMGYGANIVLGKTGGVGVLNLRGGVLDMSSSNLVRFAGASSFNFTGGRLLYAEVIDLAEPLVQNGGVLTPGADWNADTMTIESGYQLNSGVLEISYETYPSNTAAIPGGHYDTVQVNGAVSLSPDSVLSMVYARAADALRDGQTYRVLSAESISGAFGRVLLDRAGFGFSMAYTDTTVEITILAIPSLPGDTDNDGDIDDSDLADSFANYTGPVNAAGAKTPAQGDTDGDGDIDDADLGTSFSGYTGPLVPTHVPEPASLILLVFTGLIASSRRTRVTAKIRNLYT